MTEEELRRGEEKGATMNWLHKANEALEESERLWNRKLTGEGQYRPLVASDWIAIAVLVLGAISVIIAAGGWTLVGALLRGG